MRRITGVWVVCVGSLCVPTVGRSMTCSEAQTHAVWLCEPLVTGAGSAEVFGGSFTAAGWLVADDPSNRLHWDLGTQVQSGHLEVVIEGLSLESLIHANMHIIEFFDDGGHWSSARAINVRAYGDDGLDEWGDLKLKVWDNPAGLVAEERMYDFPWEGGPHVWAIDWDAASVQLSQDGTVYFDFDLTGFDTTMGHLWLPLNDWTADYSGVPGSLYRDLIFAADPPGEVPDVPGGQTTVEGGLLRTVAVDDTCVIGGDLANTVLGAEPDMSVSGDGSGVASEIGLLRFVVAGVKGTVTSATLRLHTPAADKAEGGGGGAWVVTDPSWNEEVTTWNNQPPTVGGELSSVGGIGPSQEVAFDVTGTVSGDGAWSFAILSSDSNSGHYATKELSLDMAPVLELTFEPLPPGDDDSTDPADDDSTDPPTDDDDSTDLEDDPTPGPPPVTPTFGCDGCTAAIASGGRNLEGSWGAWAAVAGILLTRRRASSPRR